MKRIKRNRMLNKNQANTRQLATWTKEEIKYLEDAVIHEYPWQSITDKIKRSPSAISVKLCEMGYSREALPKEWADHIRRAERAYLDNKQVIEIFNSMGGNEGGPKRKLHEDIIETYTGLSEDLDKIVESLTDSVKFGVASTFYKNRGWTFDDALTALILSGFVNRHNKDNMERIAKENEQLEKDNEQLSQGVLKDIAEVEKTCRKIMNKTLKAFGIDKKIPKEFFKAEE